MVNSFTFGGTGGQPYSLSDYGADHDIVLYGNDDHLVSIQIGNMKLGTGDGNIRRQGTATLGPGGFFKLTRIESVGGIVDSREIINYISLNVDGKQIEGGTKKDNATVLDLNKDVRITNIFHGALIDAITFEEKGEASKL